MSKPNNGVKTVDLSVKIQTTVESACTRRNALLRLGTLVAGAFGVGYLSAVMNTAETNADNPCGLKNDCSPEGTKCGLNGGRDCETIFGRKPGRKCVDCLGDQGANNGCPKPFKRQGYWASCCLCKGEKGKKNAKGRVYKYVDCAAPMNTPVDPSCSAEKGCTKELDWNNVSCPKDHKPSARCAGGFWVNGNDFPICSRTEAMGKECSFDDSNSPTTDSNAQWGTSSAPKA